MIENNTTLSGGTFVLSAWFKRKGFLPQVRSIFKEGMIMLEALPHPAPPLPPPAPPHQMGQLGQHWGEGANEGGGCRTAAGVPLPRPSLTSGASSVLPPALPSASPALCLYPAEPAQSWTCQDSSRVQRFLPGWPWVSLSFPITKAGMTNRISLGGPGNVVRCGAPMLAGLGRATTPLTQSPATGATASPLPVPRPLTLAAVAVGSQLHARPALTHKPAFRVHALALARGT